MLIEAEAEAEAEAEGEGEYEDDNHLSAPWLSTRLTRLGETLAGNVFSQGKFKLL